MEDIASSRRGRGRRGQRHRRVRYCVGSQGGFLGKMEFRVVHGEAPKESGGPVSFLRKQESRKNNWIPAFAGMTYQGDFSGTSPLDSCLRRNDPGVCLQSAKVFQKQKTTSRHGHGVTGRRHWRLPGTSAFPVRVSPSVEMLSGVFFRE
jgi:hypothetical protein